MTGVPLIPSASYTERLKRHMVRYKLERLNVSESGTWKGKHGQVEHAHILPVAHRRLNILPSIRDDFWTYWERERRTRQPTPSLHRGFAHLTSSQAMAFNLFFPFLRNRPAYSAPLLQALGISSGDVTKWGFEWTVSEDGTTVDCGLELDGRDAVLIEVKLSEREFGRCKHDDEHRTKFAKTYADPLRLIVTSECLVLPSVFGNYQILRNLWLLHQENTRVVFLFPSGNGALAKGELFIRGAPLDTHRSRVSIVHLELLVDDLIARTASVPELQRHMRMFREKYVALGDPFEVP